MSGTKLQTGVCQSTATPRIWSLVTLVGLGASILAGPPAAMGIIHARQQQVRLAAIGSIAITAGAIDASATVGALQLPERAGH